MCVLQKKLPPPFQFISLMFVISQTNLSYYLYHDLYLYHGL